MSKKFVGHAYVNPPAGVANGLSAVEINNRALALSKAGDHAGSEQLHLQALQIKSASFGPDSIQTALTLNALGEEQLQLGKLDDAETSLKEAVRIREAGGRASAFDAAVSRENLGQVYEAKEEWGMAREVRLSKPNQIACGHYNCPGQMFSKSAMKQCGRCQSVFYCSANCQKADWKARHKRSCKPAEDQ